MSSRTNISYGAVKDIPSSKPKRRMSVFNIAYPTGTFNPPSWLKELRVVYLAISLNAARTHENFHRRGGRKRQMQMLGYQTGHTRNTCPSGSGESSHPQGCAFRDTSRLPSLSPDVVGLQHSRPRQSVSDAKQLIPRRQRTPRSDGPPAQCLLAHCAHVLALLKLRHRRRAAATHPV